MISQRFHIDKYDWKVIVLYEVGSSDTDYVINLLKQICNDRSVIRKPVFNISLETLT